MIKENIKNTGILIVYSVYCVYLDFKKAFTELCFPKQFKEARKHLLIGKNGKRVLLAKVYRDGLTIEQTCEKLDITKDELKFQISKISNKYLCYDRQKLSTIFKQEIKAYENKERTGILRITLIFVLFMALLWCVACTNQRGA
jgi:hypothetical protein